MRVAAADEEVAVPDEPGVHRDAGLVERGAVPVDAGAAAQHVDRAGDDGDLAVAEAEQVAGGREAARPVGGADGRDARGLLAGGVDDDERDRPGLQLAALGGVEVGQDEDDAARAAGQHVVEPLLAGPVRAAQLGEHDAQALGPGDGLDALDDLHGPAGVELVEDEVEQARSGLRAAPAAAVLVAVDDLLDACAGDRGDVGAAVEDLGHRRDGDARLGGDQGDRRGAPGDLGTGHVVVGSGVGVVGAGGRHGAWSRSARRNYRAERSTDQALRPALSGDLIRCQQRPNEKRLPKFPSGLPESRAGA